MSKEEGASSSRSRIARGAALALLAAVLVIGPELIGGRPGWAVALIAAVAGAAAVAAGVSVRRGVASSLADSAPLVVVVAALAWTCAQCVPLPVTLAAIIDPRGVDEARRAAELLGRPGPGWWTIARSPWPTAEQVVVGFAIASAFSAAWWHSLARRRDVVAAAIGASVTGVALVSAAHQLLGAASIFGLYTPRIMGTIASPLVNENHLAGFLAMGVPVLLVLGLETPDRIRRLGWWGAALFASALCILCISRSGLGGLAVGLGTLAILRIRARDGETGWRSWLLVGGIATLAIGLTATLAYDELSQDLGNTNLDKVRLALRGLDLVAQQPWIGVGRGGYSEAFVALYGTTERVEQPESLLMQWASEWGLPITLLLASVLGRAWVGAQRTRSPTRMGALAGVASIVSHDFLDFAMERVAVAVVAAALLGIALAPSSIAARSSRRLSRLFPIAVGALALVATALLGPGLGDRRVREIEARLVASIEAHDDHGFDTLLVRAVELHPNEPSFAVLRAHVAVERHDRVAAQWLNRSMVLAPGWVAPHLLAARWLVLQGALSQAWLEIREAETVYEGSARDLACTLAGRSDGVDEALRLFASRPTVLDRLANCPGLPAALAARIDEALLTSDLTLPRVRIAWRANAAGDYASAIAVLEPVAAGRDPVVVLALAQTYERAGRARDAIALLGADALEPQLAGDGYRTLARAYADVGDAENTRASIDRLRGMAHGSGVEIAAALLLLGSLEHQLGNDGHALRAFEQAARLDPASQGLTEVARIAEQLGDRGRAYRAWAEVCRTAGPSSDACTSAQRLRGGT